LEVQFISLLFSTHTHTHRLLFCTLIHPPLLSSLFLSPLSFFSSPYLPFSAYHSSSSLQFIRVIPLLLFISRHSDSEYATHYRMVWEQKSSVLVMLTRLEEDEMVKAHRYWPTKGEKTYGDIKITLISNKSKYNDEYRVRIFLMQRVCTFRND
jgi:hypothetical protein